MKDTIFKLRFDGKRILEYAAKYENSGLKRMAEIGENSRRKGFVTRDDFIEICDWKTSRQKKNTRSNEPAFVEEATRASLAAQTEKFKIESLTLLHGVAFPTASVILHFCHNDDYPILDFRALWSLGVDTPPRYTFKFWWSYVEHCRRLCDKFGCDIATLDHALWQYSNENQSS